MSGSNIAVLVFKPFALSFVEGLLTQSNEAYESFSSPCYPGSLAARTSTFSITGGCANNSEAFAISAAATRPERCAWRPDSSGKASKMPNVDGPRRIANHAVVPGSSWTTARPPRRKFPTSVSFPGFASSRTSNATVTMFLLPLYLPLFHYSIIPVLQSLLLLRFELILI